MRDRSFRLLALAFCATLLVPFFATAKTITIGTGSLTGVYYPAGGAICRLLSKDRAQNGIHCTVESTDGSNYNLHALHDHDIEFGIVQSDWQYNAYNGIGIFHDVPFKDLRSVFSLHSEMFTVIATHASGVHKFTDLRGKRVNIGDPGSGMHDMMEALMGQLGWNKGDFSAASEMKPQQAAEALCAGRIDAMVFTVGHPNGLIQELTSHCNGQLVPVEGPAVDRLLAANPYFTRATIPGSMYRGNQQSTATFGVRATLVTTADMDDETVYQLTKAVFENFDTFTTLHFVFSNLDKERMVNSGLTAPIHPGALRYFREVGLIKD